MTDADLDAIALRAFDAWADEQRLTTFGRSPLRRAWMAAFGLGVELGRKRRRRKDAADA